ncbi:cytoplasmic protein NCK1-like isoform X1 [Limulus polyphemus]|uniref:Cytoplasmic protein NCK1-like isoform X1 n=1 Tax=Limulus polyphemus TaxID=6850 RepID=A0ABM1SEZ9_LIMPO|nr:cytoplasmic protein NCK1-like isoform X1 [Limulus polyphemus]
MSNPKLGKEGKATEEVYVIAKYDYAAQGSQELDIRKGERLLLLDDSKHWWKVCNSKNQFGFVPSNYVKREKPSIFDSIRKKVRRRSESKASPTGSPVAITDLNASSVHDLPSRTKVTTHITAVAKYNYTAQQSDEICLVKGARILVLEKSSDGWWKGEFNGAIGWFPSNYVFQEINGQNGVNNCPPVQLGNGANLLKQGECLDIVTALFAYTAQNKEELSFQKDENLEVIEKPVNDPGWWKVRNQNGEIGLVPKTYVEVILPPPVEDGTLDSIGSSSSAGWMCGAMEGASTDVSQLQTEMMNMGVMSCEASPMVQAKNRGPLPPPVMRQDLLGRPWYFGGISRSQCDQMLNNTAQDGDFLIRDSETNVGDFSVSLKAPIRNKHFRVHVENGIYCIGQRRFNDLDELVEHYKRVPIYTSPEGEKLFLVKPFPKL